MKNPRVRAQHRRLNQEANGEGDRSVANAKAPSPPQPPPKSFPGHVVRAGARLLRKKS